ncbi:SEC-C metal-binding domain-containing protein [Vitiosangium sp. GDMCC 1.1324]|uniref:SEC-C metal-binding domain-containing protein n=1 Tax=Vitiosangium sp. (strain GDMCC 1.1324) TaxID=2138576 RepID=UPI001E371A11|nr:SEC-C metal-binding domain-containing protein [Vitiosangium sp. GDMCC 1.1324]
MGEGDARERVRQVLEHSEKLPEDLNADLLSRGSEVVEPLLELLRDESLVSRTAPGEGFAPAHAARLLGRRRDPEALAPMVRRLMHADPGEVLYVALLWGLEAFGSAVAPVALEVLADARRADERFGLLSLLSHCGVKDERIYTALLGQLQEDPERGAMNLARYGDSRALEPLARVLDEYPLDEDVEDLFADQTVIELEDAIEQLGGTLDVAQREKVERARRSRHRLSMLFQRELGMSSPAKRRERPGRNDPCWCGSGVKYKKCHLGRDGAR